MRRSGPYPLGQFPDSVLFELGRQIVHRLAIGHGDLTGDDFGTIFAQAIKGEHRGKPLGIADVVLNGCAWSIKTVKSSRPFEQKTARLISGRNSPDYSLNIPDPHVNPENTGRAVLSIWNARVNEALGEHDDLRIVVMVRNLETKEFLIFEEEAQRFTPTDFTWVFNKRGNLEGFNRTDGSHHFTWQPHGAQFTVLRPVPGSARRFRINRNVPTVMPDSILASIRFREDWITIVG
ncbi:MAG: hypothetical protein Q7K03_12390 [Dehalococcoidia bacterium]|nr:hypothetical protein [Dehalococcoidia bacterium]